MAFPTSLPSYAASDTSMTLATLGHLARHQAMEADIVALGTKIGVDGSAVTSTHDYKLSGVTGADKAASKTGSETITNKTLSLGSNTISGTTAQFNTALSDNDFATLAGSETLTNKTIITPIIGSFANAQHDHSNAAGGGTSLGGLIGASLFSFVESGCAWSGDAYASTRTASMTSGVVWLNISGVMTRFALSIVTAHLFTASKDTYIDVDTTGALVYTEVANNAASPALTANYLRLGIIITAATNIAGVGSVNQGQEYKLLPITSSVPYGVTDSLGNLICPRDPNRKLLGERRLYNTDISRASATIGDFSIVLSCPVNIPSDRKVVVSVGSEYVFTSGASGQGMSFVLYDVTSSVNVDYITLTAPGASYVLPGRFSATYTPPAAGARTFKPMGSTSSGTVHLTGNTLSTNFIFVKVELE